MGGRLSRMGPAIAIASLLAFAATARADFVVQYEVVVPLQNTDFNTTVALPQFQPVGNEKLLGVALELNARISSAADLTFTSLTTLSLTTDALVTLVRPDGALLSVDPTASTTETLANQTFSTVLSASSTGSLLESTSPSLLLAFTGAGTIDLSFKAKGGSSLVSSTGNGGAGVVTQAGGTVTVTYRATPEPSSLLLLGLGGLGAGLLRRSRRKRAADGLDLA